MKSVTIRRELRPGDLGAIVSHHGRVYSREHAVDTTFEAAVGASVAAAGKRGWPGPRERVCIVEIDGVHAGSVALTDEGEQTAALRWVLLDSRLRGEGLGRRLIGELIEFAEHAGYEKVVLDTFSDLRAAAGVYRGLGFELLGTETGPRWGREQLSYQHYELKFEARAQLRRSTSTGTSARPFEVSA